MAMPAAPMAMPTAGPVAVPAGPVAYAPVVAPLDYTLDSGDRLRVVVFGQEGLTNAYLVDAAGCIDVPLIGQVLARGATTEELAHRIAARLRNGFIREPHEAVEVVAYRPFFILGEVTQPGQYPYVPRMTAETAVAIAGGFTPRAFRRNVTVIDRSPGGSCACRCRQAFRSGRATRSMCKSAGSDRRHRGRRQPTIDAMP
jgi:polysaccharide export outer membrane protein